VRCSFVTLVLVLALGHAQAAPRQHRLGVTLEVGAPDLVGLRLTVRPLSWLRLNLGPSTDLFGAGVAGGITAIPLRGLVSPSLTVDGGYFFAADARGIPQAFGIPLDPGRVGYGYVDGHVGLEIGAHRRVCFFLHAGVSYVDLTVHPRPGGAGFSSAHMTLWGPSAKLGLTVFI
jgi:prepilin-type processing-associated H-X9-DG protein